MANQFEEKSWAQEQGEARRIMAEQEAELAEEKKSAAKMRAGGEEQPNELSSEAADQERGARFSRAMAQARAKTVNQKTAQGPGMGAGSSDLLIKLDAQIATLAKKTGNDWKARYLMLTVGAGIADLLQLAGDATVILSIVSSLIGLVYSGARYIVLRLEARKMDDRDMEKAMLTRTLTAGVVSIIPFVNMLPENLTAMLLEWNEREKIARGADAELKKLRPQREAALAELQANEIMEAELMAA